MNTVTYEKKLTIRRNVCPVDHRSGHHKLKEIIYDLREKGYNDGDEIPYDDVEDAIYEICGIDDRTVRKYLDRLVKLGYLKPCGRLTKKRTRVSVKTFSGVDGSFRNNPKEYLSDKGFSAYCFGPRAPNFFTEQMSLPPSRPLPPSVFRES